MIEEAFLWLGRTSAGVFVSKYTAAFAATEAVHIIGLSLVGGAVLVADLAVLGLVLKGSRAATISRQLRPLWIGGFALVLVSGTLLVASGPYKYYSNPLFPLKLALLGAALAAQLALGHRLRKRAGVDGMARTLAGISLALWTGVVIAGRWLGLI